MSLNEDLGHVTIDNIMNNTKKVKKGKKTFDRRNISPWRENEKRLSPSHKIEDKSDQTLSRVMKLSSERNVDTNPFILVSKSP